MTKFICKADRRYHSACEGLPEYQDTGYCVLHFPSEDKADTFGEAIRSKLRRKDFNFAGVYFPSDTVDFAFRHFERNAYFEGAIFNKEAYFPEATFSGMATFTRATFNGMANFSEAMFSSMAYFYEATFSDEANFSETTFDMGINSHKATFGDMANFSDATFTKGAHFPEAAFKGEAYFRDATFAKQVNFFKATFEGRANFHSTRLCNATFKEADFHRGTDFTEAKFKEDYFAEVPSGPTPGRNQETPRTDFRRAVFRGELYFREANFKGYVDFYRAEFRDAVKFIGSDKTETEEDAEKKEQKVAFLPEAQVSFRRARIDRPELFSFDTLRLRPSWLVGVDARKLEFTAVEWYGLPNGPKGSIDDEIRRVRQKGEGNEHTLLAQACQRLAANAEENRDYPLANDFHYWSMDALRKEGEGFGKRFGLIRTLYWALSGYGVRPLRAFVVLIVMSLVFALLYSAPPVGAAYSLQAFEGLTSGSYGLWEYLGFFLRTEMYSLGTLARLNPEPKPEPGLFQTLVIIEGILGPLQIALLALAIRRKVMR